MDKIITVLMVDDLYANRFLVEGVLSDFRVLSASNGTEMWSILEKEIPDIILMDVMMPYDDGFSLVKKLRHNSLFKDIPIIFLTAKNSKEDVLEGVRSGGSYYITKPFDHDELIGRIMAVLEKSKENNLSKRNK